MKFAKGKALGICTGKVFTYQVMVVVVAMRCVQSTAGLVLVSSASARHALRAIRHARLKQVESE